MAAAELEAVDEPVPDEEAAAEVVEAAAELDEAAADEVDEAELLEEDFEL